MASAVNAGARLDRLPISSFHYRIFWLVGAGMFFDGYDLYVGASLEVMERDAKKMRGARPFVFTNLKTSSGVDTVLQFIQDKGGLGA